MSADVDADASRREMTTIDHERELELYHYPESLCSQMVRIALAEKGYDWKSHVVMLEEVASRGDNLTDGYLRVNPKAQVPTLVHDGVAVYDSYEIIRYLDQLDPDRGARLVPADPDRAAQVAAWVLQSSLRDDIQFGRSLGMAIPVLSAPVIKACIDRQSPLHVVWKFRKHPVLSRRLNFCALRLTPALPTALYGPSLASVAEALVSIERALERSAGDYVLGEFTQVDVMMMAHFHRVEDVALSALLDWDALPNVRAYWRRLRARPSYRAAVVDWHEANWRWGIDRAFGDGPSKRLPALRRRVSKLLA